MLAIKDMSDGTHQGYDYILGWLEPAEEAA